MFNGISLCLLQNNIGHSRLQIIEKNATKNGAKILKLEQILNETYENRGQIFMLIDDDTSKTEIADILVILERNGLQFGDNVVLVKLSWLTTCFKSKIRVDWHTFRIEIPKASADNMPNSVKETPQETTFGLKLKRKLDCDPDTNDTNMANESKQSKFVCETSSGAQSSSATKPNQYICDQLQVLAEGYKTMNDKWRALTYDKAVKQLEHLQTPITNKEQVQSLRGIGQRLTDKIWEIVQTGHLRKAEEFGKNEQIQVLNIFTNIWGVGPTTAEMWYSQGLRSLKDVEEKAKLNSQQKIGLKYFNEILERMSREEAGKIADVVTEAAHNIIPDIICQACGSYRRRKETCGDVDILLTHPDAQCLQGILHKLVKTLTETGFLTDHLVECSQDGNQKKYMGLCKLKGDGAKHRRIDIISVPFLQYPTALIYFTGSAYFTRSIYAKAKSMGMRLNQHGLRGGIMRQGGDTLNDGYWICTPTEESVFEKLGVPYRTPEERDHP